MTGWINGIYSKYHCEALKNEDEKCLKPAKLRKFRDANIPLCDECFKLLSQCEEVI